VVPPLAGDQEYQAVIDDSAHPAPKGLAVDQWSMSVADPGYRDFVVIRYKVQNLGSDSLNGLYVGAFSDFDIDNTTTNDVFTDTLRRLTYMTQPFDFEYAVGIKLLAPLVAANLSAIDHNVYINPAGMMTEAVKDSFLNGAISMPNSNGSRNWSCVVSAGPYDLAVGEYRYVAFAFVGGNTEQEMLDHADSAQAWFDRSVAVAEPVDAGDVDIAEVALHATPSPVRDRAQLSFALPQAGRAAVEVLDVEGRVVRVLADGGFGRGVHVLNWDGRDEAGRRVASGIYVYRLATAAGTASRKAVVFR
jgi:serine protease